MKSHESNEIAAFLNANFAILPGAARTRVVQRRYNVGRFTRGLHSRELFAYLPRMHPDSFLTDAGNDPLSPETGTNCSSSPFPGFSCTVLYNRETIGLRVACDAMIKTGVGFFRCIPGHG